MKIAVVAGKSLNFVVNDFSANFDFFLQKYQKSADLSANFDFLPAKSANFSANLPLKIPRNFAFFSAKYQKP